MSKKIVLRRYQSNACDAIVNDCMSHFESLTNEERVFSLQAPTGAGKTVILAQTIKSINQKLNGNVAFIWLSIGKGDLEEQSKNVLAAYCRDMNVYSLNEALLNCPTDMSGSIVVVNWEAINSEDDTGYTNLAMRNGERINFPQMCLNTGAKKIPIVLVIDESHSHANTEKSRRIRRSIIVPTYTILASATPTEKGDQCHEVKFDDVRRSGMIKNRIFVREFITHRDGIVMAAEKLKGLIVLAQRTLVAYSPKMLIYVPNIKNEKNEEMDEILSILKEQFGWSVENGSVKLALSGMSKNWEECKDNNDQTRVIITKEAIDTGIDIPSIQVIMQLRPTKNPSVKIQKLGRGLRMPEQHHYKNDLDTLFVFAFVDYCKHADFDDEPQLKDIFGQTTITIRDPFKEGLKTFPKITGSLSEREQSFVEFPAEDFNELFIPTLSAKITAHEFNRDTEYKQPLKSLDMNLGNKVATEISCEDKLVPDIDVSPIYRNNTNHIFKHSHDIRWWCIEDAIDKVIHLTPKERKIFVLNNLILMERLINESVTECQNALPTPDIKKFEFSIPDKYQFTGTENVKHAHKSFLYGQYYTDRAAKKSDLEKNFEEYLIGKSDKFVEWWYRNYDKKDGSFRVAYVGLDDKQHNFYPDNIIKLYDGRVLIVDTKGDTDQNEKIKKSALIKALTGVANVYGGIIKDRKGNFYIDYGNGEESFDDFLATTKQCKLFG